MAGIGPESTRERSGTPFSATLSPVGYSVVASTAFAATRCLFGALYSPIIKVTATELQLLEKPVSTWTCAEVGRWVGVIKNGRLAHHAVKFALHEINGELLLHQNGDVLLNSMEVQHIPSIHLVISFAFQMLN